LNIRDEKKRWRIKKWKKRIKGFRENEVGKNEIKE
jgi:hypothetical protein